MEGKICWTKKKLNKIIKWKHFVKVLYNTTCKWLIYIFLNSLCFLLLKKIKTNASCLFSNNVWQKWTKLEFEWKFQKNKLSGCLSQVSDTIFLSFNNSPKFLNTKRIKINIIFALCSFLLCQKYFLFCKIIMKILWIMKERESWWKGLYLLSAWAQGLCYLIHCLYWHCWRAVLHSSSVLPSSELLKTGFSSSVFSWPCSPH